MFVFDQCPANSKSSEGGSSLQRNNSLSRNQVRVRSIQGWVKSYGQKCFNCLNDLFLDWIHPLEKHSKTAFYSTFTLGIEKRKAAKFCSNINQQRYFWEECFHFMTLQIWGGNIRPKSTRSCSVLFSHKMHYRQQAILVNSAAKNLLSTFSRSIGRNEPLKYTAYWKINQRTSHIKINIVMCHNSTLAS